MIERIAKFCVILAIAMLMVMSALIVLQVAMRNFFDLGLPWANELARFTGIALVYFTVPYLLLHEKHIAIDLFSSRMMGRSRLVIRLFNEVATLAFVGLTLIGFQQFLARAGSFTTPSIGMPVLVFYAPAMIGTALLVLVGVVRVVALVRGRLPEPTVHLS